MDRKIGKWIVDLLNDMKNDSIKRWIYELMKCKNKRWKDERMNERMKGWMDKWKDKLKEWWINIRMKGWINEWMNDWMNACVWGTTHPSRYMFGIVNYKTGFNYSSLPTHGPGTRE